MLQLKIFVTVFLFKNYFLSSSLITKNLFFKMNKYKFMGSKSDFAYEIQNQYFY
jgi:hypothetical protein